MHMRQGGPAAACLIACLAAARAAEPPPERPLAEQPYAGLLCYDHPKTGGMSVGWILPGPLEGRTFKSPHMNRGDLILAVNGTPMGKKAFYELIERSKPGDVLTLRVRRTESPTIGARPVVGKGTEETDVRLVLAPKAQWVGPIAFARKPVDVQAVLGPLAEPTSLERFLDERIAAHKLREPIDKLLTYIADTQTKNLGVHSLSRVAAGFYRPTRLPELQKRITDPLPALAGKPADVLARAAENLDLPAPEPGPAATLADPAKALAWLATRMDEAEAHRRRAFAAIPPKRQRSLASELGEALDHLAANHYLMSHPEAGRLIAALRETMAVDHAALLAAAAPLTGLLNPGKPPKDDAPTASRPWRLRRAVKGSVLATLRSNGRWLVYGGHGPNRYDMSKIDAVIDAGGDDVYLYPTAERPAIQVVVDFAGDDRHEADAIGPASATMGVSLLVDAKGNDRYSGGSRSCGVGLLGVGLLVDRDGADTYTGDAWSLGAGIYGCGAILDLGGAPDAYSAQMLSQAVGGPRGFGLILDQGGRDLYRANGPRPSCYDTPAVFAAFSQGMGFGFRMVESGGIGVLADLGGNDRYEAGEFAQGGAYYWGLGILYDRSGNDLYYGNRYAQGFGCHQSLGILADDAGDDVYWSMTAAAQGGSWDIAMGMLIDRAGNDSYQADGLSQGSAAMQAIAWLIDLAGTDRYAGRGSVHGCSAGNSYHYADTGCFSWSLLLDTGGTEDLYLSGRPNGQTLAPGKLNEKAPEHSGLHGLFIDTPEPLRLAPAAGH